MKQATEDDLLRFYSMTRKAGDCLVWVGARRQGHRDYGRFTWQGKARSAHRWIYEQVRGPLPDDLDVMHKCDNPPCVKLSHLTVGTRTENVADAKAKGHILAGERHPNAKLTRGMATEMRRMYASGNFTQRDLATFFGVGVSTVSAIVNGRSYAVR